MAQYPTTAKHPRAAVPHRRAPTSLHFPEVELMPEGKTRLTLRVRELEAKLAGTS